MAWRQHGRWEARTESSQPTNDRDEDESITSQKFVDEFYAKHHLYTFCIAALLSYIAYIILFLIGQVWYAFIFLALAIYYIPLFYGIYKHNELWQGIAILCQFIATTAFLGGAIFFFVEIFTTKSLIFNWYKLTYGKDLIKKGQIGIAKRNARIVCIFMVIASISVFAVHLVSFILYWIEWQRTKAENEGDESRRASEITDPTPAMAIDPAIPTSSLPPDPILLPRLRTVTELGPAMAYPEQIGIPRVTPSSYSSPGYRF